SQGSAKFLGAEKNKVQAMQMAEAGVEENISNLGKRTVKPAAGMVDYVTLERKALAGGAYSSRLTTVGIGAVADTVDLTSQGFVGTRSQSIQARLKLKKYLDTTKTPILTVKPETTLTVGTIMAPKIDSTATVLAPTAMPPLNATPAYTACMAAPGLKCNICHLPVPNPNSKMVLNVTKTMINTFYKSFVGDYVTTDNTCDLYDTSYVYSTTMVPKPDTTRTIVNLSIFDTTVSIDTAVKVQVLSWR
ncbi:MAG: hypothetical protein ABI036_17345, partial [Fibrobacteria bacterium]